MKIIRKVFTVITVVLFFMLGCGVLCTYLYVHFGIETDLQNRISVESAGGLLYLRVKVYWLFISYLLITIVYLSIFKIKKRNS